MKKNLPQLDWRIFIIIILAAIPRLWQLDLMEYKADEVNSVSSIVNFYSSHQLFSTGLMSSAHINNFPLFHYLLLIPGFVSTDPLFITTWIAVINIGVVVWFYLILKQYLPPNHARIIACIYALSPWQVFFSRKIWSIDLTALFTVPLFGLLLAVIHHRDTVRTWIGIGILIVLQTQLHLSGLFFFIAFILSFGISKRIAWKPFLVGCIVGCIPALPYLHFEITSFPICPDCRSYQPYEKTFTLSHLIKPFAVIGSFRWSDLFGVSYQELTAHYPLTQGSQPISFLIMAIALLGLLKLGKSFDSRPLGILVALTPLFYIVSGNLPRLMYYQIVVPFMIFAFGIGWKIIHTHYPKIGWGIIGGILIIQTTFLTNVFQFLNQTDVIKGDYGPTYRLSYSRVIEACSKYSSRDDFQAIKNRAWLITNPLLERPETVHYRLAHYFDEQNEPLLSESEIMQATRLELMN